MMYMGEKIKNSRSMMSIAIINDSTYDIESFIKTNTRLKRDSEMALEYFKKMKSNQDDKFSVEEVYSSIFKKDENGFCDYERFQQVLSESIKNGKK